MKSRGDNVGKFTFQLEVICTAENEVSTLSCGGPALPKNEIGKNVDQAKIKN